VPTQCAPDIAALPSRPPSSEIVEVAGLTLKMSTPAPIRRGTVRGPYHNVQRILQRATEKSRRICDFFWDRGLVGAGSGAGHGRNDPVAGEYKPRMALNRARIERIAVPPSVEWAALGELSFRRANGRRGLKL
jgi:hypothetical protein